ncbi:hypothetical protein AVEN_17590-1 [Araneus ventricosus]|uniref:Uncharacterized protein n=1 Tax=Araneus ventricosus TaxID=182803 RepID=A0A4Y2SHT1_ARAVE|nr:hypothetical protein AVEN_17590-1 [Araneus ventricosus]
MTSEVFSPPAHRCRWAWCEASELANNRECGRDVESVDQHPILDPITQAESGPKWRLLYSYCTTKLDTERVILQKKTEG